MLPRFESREKRGMRMRRRRNSGEGEEEKEGERVDSIKVSARVLRTIMERGAGLECGWSQFSMNVSE